MKTFAITLYNFSLDVGKFKSSKLVYSDHAAIKENSVKTRAKSNHLEPSKNQIKYQFNPYGYDL